MPLIDAATRTLNSELNFAGGTNKELSKRREKYYETRVSAPISCVFHVSFVRALPIRNVNHACSINMYYFVLLSIH